MLHNPEDFNDEWWEFQLVMVNTDLVVPGFLFDCLSLNAIIANQ